MIAAPANIHLPHVRTLCRRFQLRRYSRMQFPVLSLAACIYTYLSQGKIAVCDCRCYSQNKERLCRQARNADRE